MNEVITIGVDLAKNVYQVHGVEPARPAAYLRRHRRTAKYFAAVVATAPRT